MQTATLAPAFAPSGNALLRIAIRFDPLHRRRRSDIVLSAEYGDPRLIDSSSIALKAGRMQVSLSIWSMDQARLAEEIERCGLLADSFHIDVMDGSLTDGVLFGPLTVQALRPLTGKPIVVHLMVVEPSRQVSRFVDAGADILAIHSSACSDMAATLDTIRGAGAGAGIAVALDEPDQPVLDNLAAVSQVIVMATALGVKGKPFDQAALRRLSLLSNRKGLAGPALFVDGGIRWSSIPQIATAGADGVVAGSIVVAADCPSAAVARIASISK